ncbi:MAG: hypothetical protein GX591_13425, partial [Planctomycetes bacterium]|nr:hypothetical protein [Planctomycetota bacterium]
FSAPYWVYRKAGRSAYAITDRRAILLDAGWFGGLNVRSFGPDELDDITRKQRADGSGDLIFRRDISHTHDSTHTRDIGFMAIRNVKDVETIIRTMVETARTNSAGPEAS